MSSAAGRCGRDDLVINGAGDNPLDLAAEQKTGLTSIYFFKLLALNVFGLQTPDGGNTSKPRRLT